MQTKIKIILILLALLPILSQSRGKWVFTHFWASWCGPCRKEMPTIQAIADEFKDSGLTIVLINTSEDEDTVFDFLSTVAPDMNTLLDSDGKVTEQWQPQGHRTMAASRPAFNLFC
jgi:thiol-disulfide isomerase/thioredoxin